MQLILHLNETGKFVIRELDSTHVLIMPEAVESVRKQAIAFIYYFEPSLVSHR
jgi:hypothetical protein